jgi:hypothetical protein
MADYLDLESNPTQNSSNTLLLRRQALINKLPEFAIIRDVADASKHAQLRPATPPREPIIFRPNYAVLRAFQSAVW